jgi:hypothetical protein
VLLCFRTDGAFPAHVCSCGQVNRAEYGYEALLALSVVSTLSLQSAGVGPGCMLCPTLTGNVSDSGKYLLLMMSGAALEKLRAQLVGHTVVHSYIGCAQ